MSVLLALVIPGAALLFMLIDGRRYQNRIDRFRQRSHVRIIRPPYDHTKEEAA